MQGSLTTHGSHFPCLADCATQEEADEIDLDPDSDEADDFAECTSPYA